MIQTEIKKLETEMLNIANEIVGDVGDNVNPDLYFKHQVGSFCINRTELDHEKIIEKWAQWITAYRDFKKLHNPEFAVIDENPKLIIRWLRRPSIVVKKKNTDTGSDTVYMIRSYLAIMRKDCQVIGPIGIRFRLDDSQQKMKY